MLINVKSNKIRCKHICHPQSQADYIYTSLSATEYMPEEHIITSTSSPHKAQIYSVWNPDLELTIMVVPQVPYYTIDYKFFLARPKNPSYELPNGDNCLASIRDLIFTSSLLIMDHWRKVYTIQQLGCEYVVNIDYNII